MKNFKLKTVLFVCMIALLLSSCTKDSDVEVPTAKKTLFAENFDGSSLSDTGWSSVAQIGLKLWSLGSYKNNGYAKMSSYQSGQPVNVTWLISPEFNMDEHDGEKLFFQTAQDGFVKNSGNSLELFISTDYDPANFAAASWQKIDFDVAGATSVKYVSQNSGILDLSKYTGTIRLAFKYVGTTSASGGYQIDNFRMFY